VQSFIARYNAFVTTHPKLDDGALSASYAASSYSPGKFIARIDSFKRTYPAMKGDYLPPHFAKSTYTLKVFMERHNAFSALLSEKFPEYANGFMPGFFAASSH